MSSSHVQPQPEEFMCYSHPFPAHPDDQDSWDHSFSSQRKIGLDGFWLRKRRIPNHIKSNLARAESCNYIEELLENTVKRSQRKMQQADHIQNKFGQLDHRICTKMTQASADCVQVEQQEHSYFPVRQQVADEWKHFQLDDYSNKIDNLVRQILQSGKGEKSQSNNDWKHQSQNSQGNNAGRAWREMSRGRDSQGPSVGDRQGSSATIAKIQDIKSKSETQHQKKQTLSRYSEVIGHHAAKNNDYAGADYSEFEDNNLQKNTRYMYSFRASDRQESSDDKTSELSMSLQPEINQHRGQIRNSTDFEDLGLINHKSLHQHQSYNIQNLTPQQQSKAIMKIRNRVMVSMIPIDRLQHEKQKLQSNQAQLDSRYVKEKRDIGEAVELWAGRPKWKSPQRPVNQ